MFARSGEITEPCGLPVFVFDHSPSSITPALSHFWISRRMRRSATRCSTNLISPLLSRLSKDTTTHYPPQGPTRAGEDHSPAAPVQRESIGGFWDHVSMCLKVVSKLCCLKVVSQSC